MLGTPYNDTIIWWRQLEAPNFLFRKKKINFVSITFVQYISFFFVSNPFGWCHNFNTSRERERERCRYRHVQYIVLQFPGKKKHLKTIYIQSKSFIWVTSKYLGSCWSYRKTKTTLLYQTTHSASYEPNFRSLRRNFC